MPSQTVTTAQTDGRANGLQSSLCRKTVYTRLSLLLVLPLRLLAAIRVNFLRGNNGSSDDRPANETDSLLRRLFTEWLGAVISWGKSNGHLLGSHCVTRNVGISHTIRTNYHLKNHLAGGHEEDGATAAVQRQVKPTASIADLQ